MELSSKAIIQTRNQDNSLTLRNCTEPQNIFYANINLFIYFQNISPLFAVFDFFTGFKTYEKVSTTESEGAWVIPDLTSRTALHACLKRLKEIQISL